MDILKVENVTKRYAGKTALDDVSLTIPQGTVYGLLGPNGAGKTTLIRIINRITAPDSGRVFFNGHEISSEDVVRIGYLPEERGLYKKMKVGEQAMFFAQLKGLSRRDASDRLKRWFRKFGIEGWWNKRVEELSKGMAQKVQFIITVLHEPELLIFDEPFSGFDPINANMLKEEILDLKKNGSTVIFSTHNMSSVEEICDSITLINNSRNILSGDVDDIRYRYGENLFRLDFVGDTGDIIAKLSPFGNVAETEQLSGKYSSVQLKLNSKEDIRQLLSVANDTVEIRGFTEVIPGMNDIFIKAVNGKL